MRKIFYAADMTKKHPITVAYGDGIGPEIMESVLRILEQGGALLEIEKVKMGEQLYLAGHPTGIDEDAWESLRRTKVFLKAPMTTPQGGGYRSLNVTVRARLGLYANIRPCVSYAPFVATKHPRMDVVIIRENEEDLYIGTEYRQSADVATALKMISRPGCERIIRYAFEYARRYGRKKVTCMTKDNILKLTDGLFHKVFDEIAQEYPDIENEHWIVDIGFARLAATPEVYDVIVTANLYGDILSDIAGQIAGSIGLSGSANIGDHAAMFEAVHGSAPKHAGKNTANPSGLLLGAIAMLVHIHQNEAATRIHNAWLTTLEKGIHTSDIFVPSTSHQKVGTQQFGDAVIKHLGQTPQTLTSVSYTPQKSSPRHTALQPLTTKRELVGVDVFISSHSAVQTLASTLAALNTPSLSLSQIFNRGATVWPDPLPETYCIDTWRCRFLSTSPITTQLIFSLLHRLADAHLDILKAENLYTFDNKPGFS